MSYKYISSSQVWTISLLLVVVSIGCSTETVELSENKNQANTEYLVCATGIPYGGYRWNYSTSAFHPTFPWVHVSIQKNGKVVSNIKLKKIAPNRWQDPDRQMTLNLETMSRGDRGIRIFDHSLGVTSPPTNPCSPRYIPCGAYEAYSCNSDSCKCVYL